MTLYCISPKWQRKRNPNMKMCNTPPKYHRELQKEPKLQLFNQLLFVSHMLNDKSGELFPLCIVVPLTTDVLSLPESILLFYV